METKDIPDPLMFGTGASGDGRHSSGPTWCTRTRRESGRLDVVSNVTGHNQTAYMLGQSEYSVHSRKVRVMCIGTP